MAIFVRHGFSIVGELYEHQTARSEWLALKVVNNMGNELIIATGYNSPDEDLDLTFLEAVMGGALYNEREVACVFAGDLNAWHSNLKTGGQRNNASGTALAEWIRSEGVQLVSAGEATHFSHKQVGRQIDLWLCNDAARSIVMNAPTVDAHFGSDHMATCLEIDFDAVPYRAESDEKRRNYRNANWHLFEERLEFYLNSMAEPVRPKAGDAVSAIDIYEAAVTKAIMAACQDAIPLCPASKLQSWSLNSEIGNALDQRNQLQRLYDRSGLREVKTEINRLTKRIAQLISNEKEKEATRYLELIARKFRELATRQGWNAASKLLNKRKRSKQIASLKDAAGRLVSADPVKARILGDSLAKVVQEAPITSTDKETVEFWRETAASCGHDQRLKPLDTIMAQEDMKVRVPESSMKALIKKLKNWKAPGHDEVVNILLKKGGAALNQHLRYLYELSLNCGYIPKSWKIGIVIPVLKEGKDSSEAGSYRPISLLSALGKTLELLVTLVLSDFLENNGQLPEHQFGFRAKRSTTDALFRFTSDIAIAMAQHKKLIAVALDFRAAFDCVWHDGLRLKMLEAGVPSYLTRWISDFLRGRSFRVRVGEDCSPSYDVNCGVPQGSPLSPLLFILFTSKMQPMESNPDDGAKKVANSTYADDALNWSFNKSLLASCRCIQPQLDRTTAWCAKWRLVLNANKCEVMVFGCYKTKPKVKLLLGRNRIPQVDFLKYLGVTFSPRLSWNAHISRISAKTRPRAGALRGIMSKKVLPVKLGVIFYRALIESVLTYSAAALICQVKSTAIRLEQMQAHGLRAAARLPYDADVASALAATKVSSIHVRFDKLAENYVRAIPSRLPALQDYIAYVANLRFDKYGVKTMSTRCPAWKLRNHLVTNGTAPLNAISNDIKRVWIKAQD